MKSVAVLLDGGFVEHRLYTLLGKKFPSADDVCQFAHASVASDEELFRIYYYDCPPYAGSQTHPISQVRIDFSASPTARRKTAFHRDLSVKRHVAFRAGLLNFDGWKLGFKAAKDLQKQGTAFQFQPSHLEPDIKQKRVDIKIGLDIAWLSSKRIVDRLILVTGDSDFVPAMKFARREGIQVVLVPMGATNLKDDLYVHADEVRAVTFPVPPP